MLESSLETRVWTVNPEMVDTSISYTTNSYINMQCIFNFWGNRLHSRVCLLHDRKIPLFRMRFIVEPSLQSSDASPFFLYFLEVVLICEISLFLNIVPNNLCTTLTLKSTTSHCFKYYLDTKISRYILALVFRNEIQYKYIGLKMSFRLTLTNKYNILML